jgi:hypothetical protein
LWNRDLSEWDECKDTYRPGQASTKEECQRYWGGGICLPLAPKSKGTPLRKPKLVVAKRLERVRDTVMLTG